MESEAAKRPGVTITEGPYDWQILQRGADGYAGLRLAGTWMTGEERFQVQARIVEEKTQRPLPGLDWRDAEMNRIAETFEIRLKVPQGGLYRVETRVRRPLALDSRAMRGDCVHHIGVGDVYLIAGQSNASGTGKGIVRDGPMLGVHLYGYDERWRLATHPLEDATGSRHPAAITGVFHGHSPWLAFGKELYRATGIPIGLVPSAVGGSGIDRWIREDGLPGELLEHAGEMVRLSGGRIAGVLWHQGETDAWGEATERYDEKLTRLLGALDGLFATDLPKKVLIGQLNATVEPDSEKANRGWSRIRDAQRRVAKACGMPLVVTADCALSDPVHNAASSNVLIGGRFTAAALFYVYGKGMGMDPAYPAPVSIRFEEDCRDRLRIGFEGLQGDWTPINGTAGDFSAEDDIGWIEIARTALGEDGSIELVLKRPASGILTVHGLYGARPRPSLFDDNGRCLTPFSLRVQDE